MASYLSNWSINLLWLSIYTKKFPHRKEFEKKSINIQAYTHLRDNNSSQTDALPKCLILWKKASWAFLGGFLVAVHF
ncbi:MAG: hypothetical protein NHB32_07375 [Fischerella sp. CENA71]|nr:hypothetical protein [Fischerella sp. CENA71]